jgi:hypothetical protein
MPRLLIACFLVGVLIGALPAAGKKGKSSFVLIHENEDANRVHVLALDKDGELSVVAGSPFLTGGTGAECTPDCQTIAVSGKLVFVGGQDGITVFKLGKSGALEEVAGSPYGGTKVVGVTVMKRGKKLFVFGTASNDGEIVGFSANSKGELTPLSQFPIPTVMDPLGIGVVGEDQLVVGGESLDDLARLQIDKNGFASVGSGLVPGDAVIQVYGDPFAPGFFYVPNINSDTVRSYNAAPPPGGSITEVAGSPFSTGVNTGYGLAIGPDLIYAVGPDLSNGLVAFTRGAGGSLSLLGNPQGPNANLALAAQDAKGKFLVAVSGNSDTVFAYRIDPDTGVLTETDQQGQTFVDDLSGIAVAKP